MYIVHVFIKVKPEMLEHFIAATLDNAANSRKEPGVARFDVIRETEDPARFVLVEVYRSKSDAALHKESAHYNRWREATEPMMAEPRTRIVYENVSPADADW